MCVYVWAWVPWAWQRAHYNYTHLIENERQSIMNDRVFSVGYYSTAMCALCVCMCAHSALCGHETNYSIDTQCYHRYHCRKRFFRKIFPFFQFSNFLFSHLSQWEREGKRPFASKNQRERKKNNEEILIEREKPLTMGFFQPLFPVAAAACAKDCLR